MGIGYAIDMQTNNEKNDNFHPWKMINYTKFDNIFLGEPYFFQKSWFCYPSGYETTETCCRHTGMTQSVNSFMVQCTDKYYMYKYSGRAISERSTISELRTISEPWSANCSLGTRRAIGAL